MTATDRDPIEDLKLAERHLPSAAVTERIRKACTRDLKPERAHSLRMRWVLTALGTTGGLLLVLGLTPNAMAKLPEELETAAYGFLGWGIVLCLVLFVGVAKPPGKRLGGRARLGIATLVPLLFLSYLGFVASERAPLGQALGDSGTLACGLYALFSSAVVAAGVMLPWRRTDPFNPGLTGALLGLGAGLAAALAVGVVCPCREGWHLWLSHGVALVVVTGLGAWVGRRWLAP